MHSGFILSKTDGKPMYLQIMEQVKQRVDVGDWPQGFELPSIRQMAADLRISVITVKRAYLELERAGVIVTQHGKGSMVAEGPGLGPRLWEQELDQHLEQAARLGGLLGLGPNELVSRLREAADRLESALMEESR